MWFADLILKGCCSQGDASVVDVAEKCCKASACGFVIERTDDVIFADHKTWTDGWAEFSERRSPRADTDPVQPLHAIALEYPWQEVSGATQSFDEKQLLGSGHASKVYRGMLQDGIHVAVKVFANPLSVGLEDEVRLLARCRHPNVVSLLGFSRETDIASERSIACKRALIYELLPGGTVFSRLYTLGMTYPLEDRVRTAIETSRGLAHLHRLRPEVFHRDIKSANILFASDGAAKIADFGLACVSKSCEEAWSFVEVASGTPGYADPLYARTNVVTEATEVYSMGMVLMELLTGRMPAELSPDGQRFKFFLEEVRPEADGAFDRLISLTDPRVQWPLHIATGLASLALRCIDTDVSRRPPFLQLVSLLVDVHSGAPVHQQHCGEGVASVEPANERPRDQLPRRESQGDQDTDAQPCASEPVLVQSAPLSPISADDPPAASAFEQQRRRSGTDVTERQDASPAARRLGAMFTSAVASFGRRRSRSPSSPERDGQKAGSADDADSVHHDDDLQASDAEGVDVAAETKGRSLSAPGDFAGQEPSSPQAGATPFPFKLHHISDYRP